MLGSGAEADTGSGFGWSMKANFMIMESESESLRGVAGRSLSETRVEAEEKPGEAIGSLWLRVWDVCAGGE